jgi:hypothetical protein
MPKCKLFGCEKSAEGGRPFCSYQHYQLFAQLTGPEVDNYFDAENRKYVTGFGQQYMIPTVEQLSYYAALKLNA